MSTLDADDLVNITTIIENTVVKLSPTIEQKINDLYDDALGRWVLDTAANTLTKYRAEGVDVLKRYNLVEAPLGTITKNFVARIPQ